MGGGTCYNGGWLPPGMTPTNLEVAIDVVATGTIRFDTALDEWFIEADNGQRYLSPTVFDDDLLVDGTRVSFQGTLVDDPAAPTGFVVIEIQTLVLL